MDKRTNLTVGNGREQENGRREGTEKCLGGSEQKVPNARVNGVTPRVRTTTTNSPPVHEREVLVRTAKDLAFKVDQKT
jgi:hypothetical protein